MAKDPYKYFRVEAREILDGLSQGVLQLESKGAPDPETVARLLRLAHTLKGAARVVKQPEIAELAHTAEGIVARHRDAGKPLSKAETSELLRLLDDVGERLSVLDGPIAAAAVRSSASARPVSEEPLETLRVEIREMDSLLRCVNEAGVQLAGVRSGIVETGHLRDLASLLLELLGARPGESSGLPRATRARSLAEEMRSTLDRLQRELARDVEHVDRELAGIRELAHRIRLIPAETVFPSLDRSVRDAAQTLGRRVAFAASGGDVRLDAHVLASLRDALMHVVRNAVAHGIEPEAERAALGKSPTGEVRILVERRGSRVAFVCRDDGRGVDLEAVRQAAVTRGLVAASDAKALGTEAILALLRGGGLTTSTDVTELSGRGIGLDVVRTTATRLKGEVSIRSEPGRGATVEVQVPISLASLQALVVEAGGVRAAIPLDAVRETLRIRASDVAHSASSDSILHEGTVLPFVPLDGALAPSAAVRSRRVWSAVVVQAGDSSVAVGVDRLLGTSNIVMRALPRVVEANPVVLGASLDAEGHPQLVLDPAGLVAASHRGRGATPEALPATKEPILVIDDSLTTRMLEQSILQSAGYEVELAISAEEGLEKARARPHSLFLVDVEMPGMNGFEFVAQTRSEEGLRGTPAILVTSRSSAEDLRRGEQAGARGYIVKGEFDQARLLQTIRRLIG